MNPTEGEIQVANEAAAKKLYDESRNRAIANSQEPPPPWEDLSQEVRNLYLDEALGPVWAALQALPDRLAPWRHLVLETSPTDFTQLQHLHLLLKEDLYRAQA